MAGLLGLGVTVGTVSLIAFWKTEPHWYGIALLAVYPPCVWIGGHSRLTAALLRAGMQINLTFSPAVARVSI